MNKRATKATTAQRIHRLADLIGRGLTDRKLLQFASETFDIGERQAYTLIRKARDLVAEDYNCERPEFVASRLAITDTAIMKAMADKRYGVVAQLIRLQAELLGLTRTNWQDSNKPPGGVQ